jgi:hypothetical protein
MSSIEKRKLERVRYWQGQKLRSRDFNDIHAVEEQRRWWHNRALHNAYGIAEGFEVSLTSDQSGVVVKAGLAYDDSGRELILESDQTVRIPYPAGVDQDLILFVRYRQKIQGPRKSDFAALCCTGTAPKLVEFVWRKKKICRSTDGVPLAEIVIKKEGTSQPPFTRPSVRSLSRPQLASGSTVPGNTSWALWTEDFASGNSGVFLSAFAIRRSGLVYGVQTTIDTSAAGFTDSPCYFAWLQGPVFNPQTNEIGPAVLTNITNQTLTSFTFRIILPTRSHVEMPSLLRGPTSTVPHKVDATEFALFARRQKLYVNWVGCQQNASAPFLAVLKPLPLFTLNLTLLETVLLKLNRL